MNIRYRMLWVTGLIVLPLCLHNISGQDRRSVREELISAQRNTGLTLPWYDEGTHVVLFADRSTIDGPDLVQIGSYTGTISSDGTEIAVRIPRFGFSSIWLGIMRSDGTNLREYEKFERLQDLCWSRDKTKMALTRLTTLPDAKLEVTSFETNVVTEIDPRAHITSQCWSPDGTRIVYEADNTVRISEIAGSSVSVLAKGSDPTWSPDGNWIAFRDQDTYYTIRPSGGDRRKIFYKKNSVSAFYWSPDSRLGAYVSQAGILEGGIYLDVEVYRLRVRRLSDNSEDWVAHYVPGGVSFQWVVSPTLLKQVQSATTPRQ